MARILVTVTAVLTAVPGLAGIESSAAAAGTAVRSEAGAEERRHCDSSPARVSQVSICLLQASAGRHREKLAVAGAPDDEALTDKALSVLPAEEAAAQQLRVASDGIAVAQLPLHLELHLKWSVANLHTKFGPFPAFVPSLQKALGDAVSLPPGRLRFLDVRGEPVGLPLVAYGNNATHALEAVVDAAAGAPVASLVAADARTSEAVLGALSSSSAASRRGSTPEIGEMDPLGTIGSGQEEPAAVTDSTGGVAPLSILDFEVMPGKLASDPTPQMYFNLLQEQLRNPESQLMDSDLAEALEGATVLLALAPAGDASWKQRKEKDPNSGASKARNIASLIAVVAVLFAS